MQGYESTSIIPASPRCVGEAAFDCAARLADADLRCGSGLEFCPESWGDVSRDGIGVFLERGAGLKWLHFGQTYSGIIR